MRSQYISKLCAAAALTAVCLFSVGETLAQCGCKECASPATASFGSSSHGGSSCSIGDCGCDAPNFGEGAPCGMSGLSLKLPSFGRRCRGGANCTTADCGCDSQSSYNAPATYTNDECYECGDCDTCVGKNFFKKFTSKLKRGPATGMKMLDRGTACDGECSGDDGSGGCSACKGRLRARLAGYHLDGGEPTGLLYDKRGGHGLGAHGGHGGYGGCGRGGCGRGGKLCGGCLARLRGLGGMGGLGGQIPHTSQPPYPGMGGQAPSYAYPYYTTRGPRDFLMCEPPTIGW